MAGTIVIRGSDITQSVADALQYISCYHPPDYVRHLAAAYEREQSPAAKNAIAQILANSRLAAFGRRPICQDTGLVVVFARVGMDVRIEAEAGFEDLVNAGVRRAYLDENNPLRPSMVSDPLFARKNTRDNTPAITHVELVAGSRIELTVAAKGGGSENRARFVTLNPNSSLADWVVTTMETLGSGWCPPGLIALGVGGSAEKAMLMAKQALNQPLDMLDLLARGPASPEEELRIELYEKVNALGIGAQGLGGLTSVVDVKLATYPSHAASKPVALIPQCAANRHIHLVLDGSGPAELPAPRLEDWPEVTLDVASANARRVDLDSLTRAETQSWQAGDLLLLSGRLLTARDAAHKRIADLLARGESLPVEFAGRVIYYVGPVKAATGETVGPAGPTTASRMDGFMELILGRTGVLATIGKAERGAAAIEAIQRHRAPYLIAVGGAAYLISKAIRSARVLAFPDLGMEAIHEFEVVDMPVTVAVDAGGRSVHAAGPLAWRRLPILRQSAPAL